MYRIYLIILIGLQFLSARSCAQNKHNRSTSDRIVHDSKLIIGRWKAENDSNIINVYTKDSCYELYGKDTTGISYYFISDSCKKGYNGGENIPVSSSYLLEHYHFYPYKASDSGFYSCYPITNLNDSALVIMNSDGSIGIFHRIK